MFKSEIEIEVTDKDIDVLGHVNNSVYSSYFAQSRLKWLDEINLTFEDRMQRNIGVVVRKLEINFNGEARLGDVLTVTTEPHTLGNRSFKIKQNIYNQNQENITEATVLLVMFDSNQRKSIKVVDEIAHSFSI